MGSQFSFAVYFSELQSLDDKMFSAYFMIYTERNIKTYKLANQKKKLRVRKHSFIAIAI